MQEQHRFYRNFSGSGDELFPFRVKVETTDLYIRAERDVRREALEAAKEARAVIAAHGAERPEFLTTFSPLALPGKNFHPLLASMYEAASAADVGPMAAVAGAVAEWVARALLPFSSRVLVENGGDIYIASDREVKVGVYAGESPFSGRLAVALPADGMPVSICTSSGTVGPSISLGHADAATIIAKSGALADAAASALGNRIQTAADIEAALKHALGIPGVLGALGIVGDRIGCMGSVRLEKL